MSIKYENRVAYYEAFASFHRDDDATPMIRIFVEAELSRLAALMEEIGLTDRFSRE